MSVKFGLTLEFQLWSPYRKAWHCPTSRTTWLHQGADLPVLEISDEASLVEATPSALLLRSAVWLVSALTLVLLADFCNTFDNVWALRMRELTHPPLENVLRKKEQQPCLLQASASSSLPVYANISSAQSAKSLAAAQTGSILLRYFDWRSAKHKRHQGEIKHVISHVRAESDTYNFNLELSLGTKFIFRSMKGNQDLAMAEYQIFSDIEHRLFFRSDCRTLQWQGWDCQTTKLISVKHYVKQSNLEQVRQYS